MGTQVLDLAPVPHQGSDDDQAPPALKVAEFFAGIGLVAEALQPIGFDVAWANDILAAKRDLYRANHPGHPFHLGDVRDVHGTDLPSDLDLATSSFPCIDLSLAGNRKGLAGVQSGMFWQFARVIDELGDDKPRTVLLENVLGFATSHGGADLEAAITELNRLGYSCDVFFVDARHFVPQSRPRMFVAGLLGDLPPDAETGIPPLSDTRPAWVQEIHRKHQGLRMHHLDLPQLPDGPEDLSGVVQKMDRNDARWWEHDRTTAFVESLSPTQATRFEALRDAPTTTWRTAYRRTRNGVAVWELRRDAIGGCLRTTGGGSSKQALVELGRGEARVRWMTPLEYARLMGAGSYKLRSGTPNQALFGFGDAVVVDVIRWIGQHYLLPALRTQGALVSA